MSPLTVFRNHLKDQPRCWPLHNYMWVLVVAALAAIAAAPSPALVGVGRFLRVASPAGEGADLLTMDHKPDFLTMWQATKEREAHKNMLFSSPRMLASTKNSRLGRLKEYSLFSYFFFSC